MLLWWRSIFLKILTFGTSLWFHPWVVWYQTHCRWKSNHIPKTHLLEWCENKSRSMLPRGISWMSSFIFHKKTTLVWLGGCIVFASHFFSPIVRSIALDPLFPAKQQIPDELTPPKYEYPHPRYEATPRVFKYKSLPPLPGLIKSHYQTQEKFEQEIYWNHFGKIFFVQIFESVYNFVGNSIIQNISAVFPPPKCKAPPLSQI